MVSSSVQVSSLLIEIGTSICRIMGNSPASHHKRTFLVLSSG